MLVSLTENHPFPLCKLICSGSWPLEEVFLLPFVSFLFFPILTCLLQVHATPTPNWFGFWCLKASFQVFAVRAAQKRSWAISVMPLLLQPNNCRTYCNCTAGNHVYLRSSMMFDFYSVTGIQITVNWCQDLLFCWRSLLCHQRFKLVGCLEHC